MADRSVVVRLRAEIGQFKAGMEEARAASERASKKTEESAKRSENASNRLGQSLVKNREHWDRVGTSATVAGAAATAALALSTKATIDWESAWAGVNKTVSGTPAQMAQLETELRGLTRVLPATHDEIAGVAEAAGQLGVARGDIVGFTRTMIDLGESTNLTSDQAATAIAQISNVMGTMRRDGVEGAQRFGAALVALGNDGASTEAEILAMAQRLAGAGKLVGASESDILALANAMASMGIEAELGGGAMSRTITKIVSAVKGGGEELEGFAKIAGVSASEFARQFSEDPIRAVDAFVQGLNRIDESGGNVIQALGDVGIEGTQDLQVLLRLKGAGDLLADSLDLGAQAWEENSALATEAGKRYETTASQLAIARNSINDAAIDFGSVAAPAVKELAGGVASLAGFLADLPPWAQQAVAGIGGLGGASLLAFGGTVKLVTAATDLGDSLRKIEARGPRAARGLDLTTKAVKGLGVATAVLVAAGVLDEIFGTDSDRPGVEALTRDLTDAGDAVAVFNDRLSKYAAESSNWWSSNNVTSYGDAIHDVFNPSTWQQIEDATGSLLGVFGMDNNSDIANATAALADLDGVLAGLVASGRPDEAARQFKIFADAANLQGVAADDLRAKLPAYAESVAGVDNEQRAAAKSGKAFTGSLDDIEGDAEEAAERLNDLFDAITSLGAAYGDERAAASAYQTALAETIEANKELADIELDKRGNIKLSTEAGREAEGLLRSQAEAALQWAGNMVKAGADQKRVTQTVDDARDAFIKQAIGMDIPRKKAEELATKYGLIPEDVTTMFKASTEQATTDATTYKSVVDSVPAEVGTYVTAPGATESLTYVERLRAGLTSVPDDTKAPVSTPGTLMATFEVNNLKYAIDMLHGKKVPIRTSGVSESIAQIKALREQIALLDGRFVVTGTLPNGGRNQKGGVTANADGNILAYDTSLSLMKPGIIPSQAHRGGLLVAEEGAGPWEAFISGHPAKADRSRSLLTEVASRLGMAVVSERAAALRTPSRFADGGIWGRPGVTYGSHSEEYDNSVNLYGPLILPSANVREVRRDVRKTPTYRAKSRPGR